MIRGRTEADSVGVMRTASALQSLGSLWRRNRLWIGSLAAICGCLFLLWFFGPHAEESELPVFRPLAGVIVTLALVAATLSFMVTFATRVAHLVRTLAAWIRFVSYVALAGVLLAFGFHVMIVTGFVILISFGNEGTVVYKTDEGRKVVTVQHGWLDVTYTYHHTHGPFFRSPDELSVEPCQLTIAGMSPAAGRPHPDCRESTPAVPPEPVVPAAGELYFETSLPASSTGKQMTFWAYSSASSSTLQRSVDGADRETVSHPQGSAESLRFIHELERLEDGRLRAVVGYPEWTVDAETTEIFHSDDDGASWHQ